MNKNKNKEEAKAMDDTGVIIGKLTNKNFAEC